MTWKISLDKTEVTNLQRSFVMIATALNTPRISPVNTLLEAWLMIEFKRLAKKMMKYTGKAKKRYIEFTVADLTAIVMFEEKHPAWIQFDDYILFPLQHLNMMLMQQFINSRSIHNTKFKSYETINHYVS